MPCLDVRRLLLRPQTTPTSAKVTLGAFPIPGFLFELAGRASYGSLSSLRPAVLIQILTANSLHRTALGLTSTLGSSCDRDIAAPL